MQNWNTSSSSVSRDLAKFYGFLAILVLALMALPRPAQAQAQFQSQVLISGFGNSYVGATGDLTHNGNQDIVGFYGPKLIVALDDGTGHFPTINTIPLPWNVQRVALADMNGDGNLDIVLVANIPYQSGVVAVMLGDGHGSFGPPITYQLPAVNGAPVYLQSLAIADFNGDGRPDVAVVSTNQVGYTPGGQAWVLFNLGNGALSAPSTPVFQNYMGYGSAPALDVAAGDLDGDGHQDIVLVGGVNDFQDFPPVVVLWGQGNGSFTPMNLNFALGTSGHQLSHSAQGIALADLSGDGRLDVLVSSSYYAPGTGGYIGYAGGSLTVFPNLGSRSFGAPVSYVGPTYPWKPQVGDLNNDGHPDVVIAGGQYGNLVYYLNDGSGGLQTPNTIWTKGGESAVLGDFSHSGSGTQGIAFGTPSNGTYIILNGSAIAASTTTVAASANPSVYGQAVTFTATVTGTGSNTPTGTVTFKDGMATLGSVSLNAEGQAAFTTASLAVGAHAITASYGGDARFAASASTAFTQTVNKAETSLALTSSANPALLNQPITLTAMLSVVAPGAGSPTGTVQFLVDGSPSGAPVSLAAGKASLSLSNLSVGSHTIYADYSGDADFLSSTGELSQTVAYRFLGLYAPYSALRKYQPGQAIPLIWQYADYSGQVVNSSGAEPAVSFSACAGSAVPASAAGASGYQYSSLTNTWQFNWKTTGVTAGCYNLTITSMKTGQSNGPFPVQFR